MPETREARSLLCCPECHAELSVRGGIYLPGRRLKSGVFFCPICRDIAGAIRNFKFDFVHFDRAWAHVRSTQPESELPGIETEIVPCDDRRIVASGFWEPIDGGHRLNHGTAGDRLRFRGEFLDAGIRLMKHPWSGIAEIFIDGILVREIDLYQPQWSTVTWFSIANDLEPGPHELEIRVTGR